MRNFQAVKRKEGRQLNIVSVNFLFLVPKCLSGTLFFFHFLLPTSFIFTEFHYHYHFVDDPVIIPPPDVQVFTHSWTKRSYLRGPQVSRGALAKFDQLRPRPRFYCFGWLAHRFLAINDGDTSAGVAGQRFSLLIQFSPWVIEILRKKGSRNLKGNRTTKSEKSGEYKMQWHHT